MKFRTQFDSLSPVFSEVGSPERTLYGSHFDERGRIELEETGKENIYDYIQSFKDSTNIHVILKRFANGEKEVLERVQSTFADVTDFPVTYAELLNTVNDGEAFFNSLPKEVRAQFDHSFGVFMAGMQDGSTFEKLGYKQPVPDSPAPDLPEAVVETKEAIKNEP